MVEISGLLKGLGVRGGLPQVVGDAIKTLTFARGQIKKLLGRF